MNMILVVITIISVIGAIQISKKNKELAEENRTFRHNVTNASWSLPSRMYTPAPMVITEPSMEKNSGSIVSVIEEKVYMEAELGEEVMAFFESLEPVYEQPTEYAENKVVLDDCTLETRGNVIELTDEEEDFIDFLESVHYGVKADLFEVAATDIVSTTRELLTLDDCDDAIEVNIPAEYRELADHEIVENYCGFQSWVAQVIGTEKEYLHLSDGTARIWVNVSIFGKEFVKGDIVFIEATLHENSTLIMHTINRLEIGRKNDCWDMDEFNKYMVKNEVDANYLREVI